MAAQPIPITVLPAAPQDVHFDQHQFIHPNAKAVTKFSRITHSDYQRMHVLRLSTKGHKRKPTPDWVLDKARLQRVILVFCERRYGILPPYFASYEERIEAINKRAAARREQNLAVLDRALGDKGMPEREVQTLDTRAVLDARGMVGVVSAVVYLSYNLAYNSTQVAAELGVKPPHVRILLYRLGKVAKLIAEGRPYRGPRPGHHGTCRRLRWTPGMLRKFKAMRESGKTWRECGTAFGASAQGAKYVWLRHLEPKTATALEVLGPRR